MGEPSDSRRMSDALSDSTKPGSKRKRTSRACDQCRSRKHRCDGKRPKCLPCIAMNQDCTYGTAGKKRGLPTGYVKSLELLLSLVFATIPNGERVVSELLADAEFALDQSGRLRLHSRPAGTSDAISAAWSRSSVLAELNRRLKRLETGMEGDVFADSETSQDAPLLISPLAFDEIPRTQSRLDVELPLLLTGQEAGPSQSTPSEAPPTSRRLDQSDTQTLNEPLQYPDNARSLLDLYFSYTHCWLPILEKHKLFQILYSTSNATSPHESGDVAVFWAVLAFSTLQKSCRSDPASRIGSGRHRDTCREYKMARQLIPDEMGSAQLSHAQALLVLALCQLHWGCISSAWQLVGQAVRICLIQKSNQRPTSTGFETPQSSIQTRCLHASFALDTFLSCSLQKPAHLKTQDMETFQLYDAAGPDEWDPWVIGHEWQPSSDAIDWQIHGHLEPLHAVSTFNAWLQVSKVLNNAMSSSDTATAASNSSKFAGELLMCYSQLPRHCAAPPQGEKSTSSRKTLLSPALVNLHLAFAVANDWITVQSTSTPGQLRGHEPQRIFSLPKILSDSQDPYQQWTLPPIVSCYRRIGRWKEPDTASDLSPPDLGEVGNSAIPWDVPFPGPSPGPSSISANMAGMSLSQFLAYER
jgi:hypothetical protein